MQSSADKSWQRPDDRSGAAGEVRFGAFRYLPDQSILLKEGKRVRIGSRALSLLKVLAAHAGHFVPNDVLIAAAWPNTTVENTNLRVQMTALRRLLTDDGDLLRITNAPGRGYALTVAPGGLEGSNRLAKHGEAQAPAHALPTQLTSLVGRHDDVATVVKRLLAGRFVSVVGPGGIGKTRVAIEACVRLIEEGHPRICFVDLAPLSSGEFVASAVATALQVADEAKDAPMEASVTALQRSRTLLVLDNCEHVLDAAAELSEKLLRAVADVRILATSREPLLVDGEVTIRLAGLGGPEDHAGPITLQEAMTFPAVQLLADRAGAGADKLSFDDSDAPLVAEICRRLDGIPMAIELAAASVASLGVRGVAALVRKQFATLSAGRRTAPPRQRTLRATLEWSYDNLSNDERELLARLSVFQTTFSLAGAQAVNPLPPEQTALLLANLVAKSLAVVDHSRPVTRFRLLQTTRRFAEEKLHERKDIADVRRRHAEHLVAAFAAELTDVKSDPFVDRRQEFRSRVDDVRAALSWCLSPAGDSCLGAILIINSAPMWMSLSILSEYVAIVDGVADRLWQDPSIDPKTAMWLATGLHLAQFHTAGISASMAPMLLRALEVAELHGDVACQLACLWGMFGTRMTEARYGESLEFAQRFADLTPQMADSDQGAVGQRIVGLGKWRNGDLAGARQHSDMALASVDPNSSSFFNQLLIYKQGTAARASASNLLWLTGFADQAVVLAEDAVTMGLDYDVLGLCYGLAQAIVPLAFWTGELDQARAHTMLLVDLASDKNLGFWLDWGRSYESALQRLTSRLRRGPDFIDTHAASLGDLHRQILATILGDAHGLVVGIDLPQTHWCAAELLRVAALGLMREGKTPAAQRLLSEAVHIARRQGAFAWELRAATTLAEVCLAEGQSEAARAWLVPVAKRATEGFETGDFRRAIDLMARIDAA